ncbi:MAG: protein disulfide oxidoreductase [Chloroflexota bacterium]
MEKLLNEQIVGQVKEVFDGLKEPVQLLFFGSEQCDYCPETRQLVDEVAETHASISTAYYDLEKDADVAARFNVDKAPVIVIAAKNGDEVVNYGIQYSGIPSGHEFSTLINDIILVSGRDSGLDEETRAYLKALDKPLHMQVFVTPTCPYCPRAVLVAHQMAMENPAMIRAEGVEATEFPDLANKYNVSGVPQTTINAGRGTVVGAVPVNHLLDEIKRALLN